MGRTTWNIYTSIDNGGNWLYDGVIYVPNDSLTLGLISNLNKSTLADGNSAYTTPETKYAKEPLTFQWQEILESDTFRTKIENYIINQNYIGILTHLNETLIGKFTSVKRVWLSGKDDTYDIEATFERMV